MNRTRMAVVVGFIMIGVCSPSLLRAQPTELFFSEYVEGSSNNKALEIYNGTNAAIDLAAGNYSISFYFNGSATPSTPINLTGMIASGDVFVFANSSADAAILAVADQTSGASFYNGDDAIVLRKGMTVIDSIGQVGFDPGSEWGTGNTSTQDNTMRRKETVIAGDTNETNVYDPAIEWDGFANNTFDGLGVHVTGNVLLDCNSPAGTQEGVALMHEVTASDSDGTVVDISLTSVMPTPAPGMITLTSFTAAAMVGGTATAEITVTDTTPQGIYTIVLTAVNDDGIPQMATCNLTIAVTGFVTIADIQGSPLTQGPDAASPFNGIILTTSGIVTALKSNGFFMQMPDPGDSDPETSDGIFAFTGGAPPVMIGDEVDVTGTVVEFFGMTEFSNGVAVNVLSTGNSLPAAVPLTATFPTANGGPAQLERVEAMLVAVTSGTVNTPGRTDFGIQYFYGVAPGVAKPVREAGLLTPGLPNLPVYDGNPEGIRVDMAQLTDAVPRGGAADPPTAGMTFSAQGPIEFAFSEYRLNADSAIAFSGAPAANMVRARGTGEFTIASFNTEFLDAADTTKTQKAARLILDVLDAPDIIALEEVVNQAAANALVAQIAVLNPAVTYTAFIPADSDGFAQEVGYLYRGTVTGAGFTELGLGETYPNSAAACSPEILHNRPPLIMDATVTPPGGQPFAITLINVHMRSLSGVDDAVNGERVRLKRFLGARSLAGHIQDMRDLDPNRRIMVLGDFNAYNVTDSYVDVAGIIAGDPDFDLIESNSMKDLVEPNLIKLIDWLPIEQQYSFVFGPDPQVLDQMLITDNFGCSVAGIQFGRVNADFPAAIFGGNTARPERASDHDSPVAFIQTQTTALPTIFIGDASIVEGSAGTQSLAFRVGLCSSPASIVTVDWETRSRSALGGVDFVHDTGQVSFNVGETTKMIMVDVSGDGDAEGNERFTVDLTDPVNAVIADSQGIGLIIDDDGLPALEISVSRAKVRGEPVLALKAFATGGTGAGTYSVQWEELGDMPVYLFEPGENPAVVDPPIGDIQGFKVTVSDATGTTATRFVVTGDPVANPAPFWLQPANDYDFDGDRVFTVRDWVVLVSNPIQTEYIYPCD